MPIGEIVNSLVGGQGEQVAAAFEGFLEEAGVLPEGNTNWTQQTDLMWPSDLMDTQRHQTYFVIRPYREEAENKGTPTPEIRKTLLPFIRLPLPHGFVETYAHEYEVEDMLWNPNELRAMDKDTDSARATSAAGQAAIGLGTSKLSSFIDGVTGGLGSRGINTIRSEFHGGARVSIELLYNNPVLREWTFNYRFLARSKQEEDNIREIITYLKWCSAPVFSLVAQRYPCVFDLYFGIATSMSPVFQFTSCALQSITWDPDPNGGKMMLSKTGFPIDSTISLTFKETRYLDRATIKKEWDEATRR